MKRQLRTDPSVFGSTVCDRGSTIHQGGGKTLGVHLEKRRTLPHAKIKKKFRCNSSPTIMSFPIVGESLRIPSGLCNA